MEKYSRPSERCFEVQGIEIASAIDGSLSLPQWCYRNSPPILSVFCSSDAHLSNIPSKHL